VLNLSGGGATAPLPLISAYAAGKAAVVRLTETLAHEYAAAGVTVNALAPGALNTGMLQKALDAGPDAVGADFYAKAVKQSESGGTPMEYGADLAVWAMSDDSKGITGRLLSAVWDPWKTLGDRAEEIRNTDIYTLRRIVPADRGKTWGDK
jgi:3-oxoacyl-[acyl-carrier protein] reductase